MSDGEFRADASAFDRGGRALRAGGGDLRRRWADAIRAASREAGEAALSSAGRELPHRGGLARRVAGSTVVASVAGLRGTASLRSRHGDDLSALNAGALRHPVFARAGRRPSWVTQPVRPGVFRRALQKEGPAMQARLEGVTSDAIRHIAKGGSGT